MSGKGWVRTHNEIAGIVIDTALRVHRALGPGLLESVYQHVLVLELQKRGLAVRAEEPISVVWEGVELDIGFRADLVVEDRVIVELKSIEAVQRVHKKVLLTYLVLRKNGRGCC